MEKVLFPQASLIMQVKLKRAERRRRNKSSAKSSSASLYFLRQSICEVWPAGGSVLSSRPHHFIPLFLLLLPKVVWWSYLCVLDQNNREATISGKNSMMDESGCVCVYVRFFFPLCMCVVIFICRHSGIESSARAVSVNSESSSLPSACSSRGKERGWTWQRREHTTATSWENTVRWMETNNGR